MAARPPYSVAPSDKGRDRVLSAAALWGIVGIAVVGLVLVFPRRDLLSLLRSETAQGNQQLTVAYLRNIIRTEPRDLNLRFLLVEKLLEVADLGGARQALAELQPLVADSPEARARWAEWDLNWWLARYRETLAAGDLAASGVAAARIAQDLERQLDRLQTPAPALALLARVRALNDVSPQAAALSRKILQRILGMPAASMAELAAAGTQALADGVLPLAAELFFAARRKTVQSDARASLLLQGVRALLASGEPVQAYEAAVRETTPLPAGDAFYWTLVDLALGAGRPRDAASHLRQLVPASWDTATLAARLDAGQLQRAYDVFAAGADLQRALKLTQAALLQSPGDLQWQERHAQVAEWAGRPPEALAAWVELLQRDAGTRALDNVFRLAPMLYADDALLAAWTVVSQRRALSDEEIVRIVATYERLGDVAGALQFLDRLAAGPQGQQAGARQKNLWQSQRAALLQRAGRIDEAVAALEALRLASGDDMARDDAVRLAQLYLKQGQQGPALRALQAWHPGTGAFDQVYWDLTADLAYEYGQHDVALRALSQLLERGSLKPYQAERLVRYRIDDGDSAQALTLAARLYARMPPDDDFALAWLDAVRAAPLDADPATPVAATRWSALRQLLATLTPAHRARLEQGLAFLERRADLYTSLGQRTLALRDYRTSLALRPEQTGVRMAYWWLLIDGHDTQGLRRELAQNLVRVRGDAAYREVLAAAWLELDEPRRALGYLQAQSREKSQDFLWLMNYADVLERAGSGSAALRVRRHAWTLAARAVANPKDRAQARQALMTQLRLAEAFASGSQKQLWLQQLGALLREPGTDAATRRQAQELVGAWLLSEGRLDAARRWLWQQQLQRIATPAYQELALALADGDNDQLDRLLERAARAGARAPEQDSPVLATIDRLAALRQLQRSDQAAVLASGLAQRAPEGPDDEAQAALQDDLLKLANRASVQAVDQRLGPLSRSGVRADASLGLTPRLRLTAEISSLANRVNDGNQLGAVPARDRELRLGVLAQTPWGELAAQLLSREALAPARGLYLRLTQRLDPRTLLQTVLARHERSDDSAALSVAGLRDRAAANLSYTLGKEAELQASLAAHRFHTQTGAYLGRSADASVGAAWYLRRDYPDVRIQGALRRSVIRADGQPDAAMAALFPGNTVPGADFFLGPSSTAFTLTLGLGLSALGRQDDPALAAGVYSRAWRPFAEFGVEARRGASGQATQGLLRLGAKGAVTGRDQLGLSLDVRPSPPGQPSSSGSRELRIQYEAFFDR